MKTKKPSLSDIEMNEKPAEITVGINRGYVCVTLGKEPLNFLKMTPDEARGFANILIDTAENIAPS